MAPKYKQAYIQAELMQDSDVMKLLAKRLNDFMKNIKDTQKLRAEAGKAKDQYDGAMDELNNAIQIRRHELDVKKRVSRVIITSNVKRPHRKKKWSYSVKIHQL